MQRAAETSQRQDAVLCGVFFLSGASALIFESLWFRLAGLAFGNSVWASALVLSSFMAGLALGNGLSARHGGRVRRPVRLYATVELIVAATGILLVLLFPHLTRALAPLFRALLEQPVLLNALRLSISFLVLIVPATAMGMTLPLLMKALYRQGGAFGPALGRLYGWNTLGAVAGSLLAETVLLETFGITGTGLWAGLLNVLAALGATAVCRGNPVETAPVGRPRPSARARRLLVAAFLSGGILLALEVVWFRFLQLFLPGTSLSFALLLWVVLSGIGFGGLAAARLFRGVGDAHRLACAVAVASGAVCLLAYLLFDLALGERTEVRFSVLGLEGLPQCVFLMLPSSFVSGVLFALIGAAVQEELRDETRSAGLVTMANTLGATLGPLVAGFVLIPGIGMERSFFVLGLAYAAVALLLVERTGRRRLEQLLGLAFAALVISFPFGRMERYVRIASAAYRGNGEEVVAVREGLTETIQYLRRDFMGQPLSYRLVTNSFSMAGTDPVALRYMKYYAYWPAALHPGLREALLISFGTGSTAKALTDTSSLRSIVVVDISREILEMATVVYPPGTNPLDDPRVEVRVEDGRFFLQTTDRRFDLITSEPPPLKLAGVVNLYSREYFQLLRDRLAEGGVVTYWLPVAQLREDETKAILRAFVEAFGEESTLWVGNGLDWMLVGSRGARGPVSTEQFARQWDDPVVGPEMRALGFEDPGQIGATFLMGAEDLRLLTAGTAPLTDDWPRRLSPRLGSDPESLAHYLEYMDTVETRKRFEASPYCRALWPVPLRQRSVAFFDAQQALNRLTVPSATQGNLDFAWLHHILMRTSLRTPVLWAFGSTARSQAILRELDIAAHGPDAAVSYELAVEKLAERDLDAAERLLAEARRLREEPGLVLTHVYLLCLLERVEEARRLVAENGDWFRSDPGARVFLQWLSSTFGFEPS